MKKGVILFSVIMSLFFLTALGFSQRTQSATAGDALSHTEDQTWFHKSRGTGEMEQSGQKAPWRMASWEERVNHFIEALQGGNRHAFLYVEYNLLDGYARSVGYPKRADLDEMAEKAGRQSLGVIWKLYNDAVAKNTSIVNILTENGKYRKEVIQGVLAGLFNKDPRVRLVAVNLLRRLRPDASMAADVKKALVLETVTTERAKWRDKDIDIPSIENPRLGWGAVAWRTGAFSPDGSANVVDEPFKNRFYDGSEHGSVGLLQGHGTNRTGGGDGLRGDYLVNGLYRGEERNDFPVVVEDVDYALPRDHPINTDSSARMKVWTKAALLRYGADEHISGYETSYGFKDREYMPRFVYAYIDYRNPDTAQVGESVYSGYHSVWEEMKKLDLFISRAVWVERVKRGDMEALRYISKDTFRTLADQIDGESLAHVPFKSPGFGIFGESEFRQVIVGMLENRVVSTREECIRFLRRLFDNTKSIAVKREIKKALREARRRELVIDTIRGRHVHEQLNAPKAVDEWWGEYDEVDTSRFSTKDRSKLLQIYRHQVEYPEETDIIYHDRRKPGQEEGAEEKTEETKEPAAEKEPAEGAEEKTTETTKTGEGSEPTAEDKEAEAREQKRREDSISRAHPLVAKLLREGKNQASLEDLEQYLQLEKFRKGIREGGDKKGEVKTGEKDAGTKDPATEPETKEPATEEKEPAAEKDGLRPGQAPGERETALLKKLSKDEQEGLISKTATEYQVTRGIETLMDLFAGNGQNLLQATYSDLQTAILVWLHYIRKSGATVDEYTFINYMLAGALSVPAGAGSGVRDYGTLPAEYERRTRVLKIMDDVIWPKTQQLMQKYQVNKSMDLGDPNKLKGLRDEIYNTLPEDPKPDDPKAIKVPGKSDLYGTEIRAERNTGKTESQRLSAERAHGKYYGHGRGGYYNYYDNRFKLDQSENDSEKVTNKFYYYPAQWRQTRTVIIKGLLTALTDRDPLKRLIIIHFLRRLIPDPTMHGTVLKLLREVETVDKRPYLYADILGRPQEKIVVHELLKLQRFILRRILVGKIKSKEDPDMLKNIPKGGFLPLVVRIDAEWDPFRIPLRTPIPFTRDNGMFFTKSDIGVISGGLDNRNFLVQREVARWIVSFYNQNRGGHIGDPDGDGSGAKFLSSIKKAESKDVIYYERNYVVWEYVLGYLNPTVSQAYDKAIAAYKKALNALETKNDASYTEANNEYKKAVEQLKAAAQSKQNTNSYKTVVGALDKVGQAIDAKDLNALRAAEAEVRAAQTYVSKSTEYSEGKVPTYTPDQNITTPVGRIPVKINTWADRDIFRRIDADRRKEFVTDYGRGTDANRAEFESIGTYSGEANIRKSYDAIKKDRSERMKKIKSDKWDTNRTLGTGGDAKPEDKTTGGGDTTEPKADEPKADTPKEDKTEGDGTATEPAE